MYILHVSMMYKLSNFKNESMAPEKSGTSATLWAVAWRKTSKQVLDGQHLGLVRAREHCVCDLETIFSNLSNLQIL